ncbi:MAG: UbiA family prenyltransferase [TACK group archaeon]|nr:UbiA family prenyltransferase [TACK group archaeon]
MSEDYAYWQPRVRGKLGGILRIIKLQHAPLVEGPALLGAFAVSVPSIRELLLILAAAFSVHVFGETYNELVGVRWHANDPVKRPFAAGTVSIREGQVLVLMGIAGLLLSAYALNFWAFVLSPIAIAITLVYPHLKDKTAASTYVLSSVVAVAVAGGYVGVCGGKVASFLLLMRGIPYLLALSGLFFTAYFDEVANMPNVELHRSVGIAEFSAVKPASFTLGFMAFNGLTYLLTALVGTLYLSPVAFAFSLASAAVWVWAYGLARAKKYGQAVDRSLLAWFLLVLGVIVSRLLRSLHPPKPNLGTFLADTISACEGLFPLGYLAYEISVCKQRQLRGAL